MITTKFSNTKGLYNKADCLVDGLLSLKDKEERNTFVDNLFTELLQKEEIGQGYVRRIITEARKIALEKGFDKELVRKYFNVEGLTEKYNKRTQDNIRNKRIERFPFKSKPFIDVYVRLINSNAYAKQILGLCGLTGRRRGEIFVGKFEVVNDNTIAFMGQLKTKSRETEGFDIPVLYNAQIIVDKINKLQKDKNILSETLDMSMSEFIRWFNQNKEKVSKTVDAWGKKISPDMSTMVQKEFASLLPDNLRKPHCMRHVYAAICINRYKDRLKPNDIYISEILGHAITDRDSFRSYDLFLCDD